MLWDVDLSSIDLKRHEKFVIERVLEFGDDKSITWLRKKFQTTSIADVVRSSRRISPNTANLWALVLGIPKKNIECLKR